MTKLAGTKFTLGQDFRITDRQVIELSQSATGSVSVLDFGAKGDGVADDAVAIRAAISAAAGGVVMFPAGTYRIKSTIAFNGAVSAIGLGAVLLFDHTGAFTNGSSSQLLVRFGNISPWAGYFSGFTIQFTSAFNNVYVLSVRGANGFTIRDNQFQGLNSTIGGSIICSEFFGQASGAGSFAVSNGLIQNNTVIFDPLCTTCEGGSNQGWWSNVKVVDNTFIGFGDDSWACHGGNRIQIRGNYFESKIGRILLESHDEPNDTLRHVDVSHNIFRKINSSGSSSGIFVAPLLATSAVPKHISITDNLIINDDATYDLTYPIVLRGGENIVVARNVMINNRGAGTFILRAASHQIDATVFWMKNVVIKDNHIFGGGTDIGQTAGGSTVRPIIVADNFADGGGFTTSPIKTFLSPARGEVARGNIAVNGDGYDVVQGSGDAASYRGTEAIGDLAATGITTDTNLTIAGAGGEYLFFPRAFRLSRLEVRFSAVLPNETCYLQLYSYDGIADTLIATTYTLNGIKGAYSVGIFDGDIYASRISIAANLGLKIRVRADTTIGGLGCTVRVFGEYVA
jgi:hypothetical protein